VHASSSRFLGELLVTRMVSRIKGGADRPLMNVDQINKFTALKPKSFSAV
jgi:hypothetical protein